jgi:hypothetical protein
MSTASRCKKVVFYLADKISSSIFAENSATMNDKYQIPYINACIRAFAKHYSLPLRNAYQYLKHFKGIDFLVQFYEVEHLSSIRDAVEDLTLVCKKNGGALG